MTPKAAVSALRRLPLFERVSLRLLQDLVEFASLETWWDESEDDERRTDTAVARVPFLQSTRPGGTVSERRFDSDWLRQALRASFSLARSFADGQEVFHTLAPGQCRDAEAHPMMHWLFLTKDEQFVEPGRQQADVDVGTAAVLLARALARTTAGLREAAVVATMTEQGVVLQRWDGYGPGGSVQLPAATFGGGYGLDRDGFPAAQFAQACRELGGCDQTAWHVVCVAPAHPQRPPAWWTDRFGHRGFHRIIYLTRPDHSLRPPPEVLQLLLPGAWNPRRKDGPYFSSVIPTVVLPQPPAPRPGFSCADLARDLPTLEVSPWQNYFADDAQPEPRTVDTRLRRDLCRVRLRLDQLATCDREPAIADSLDRWARAVTNRQVGLALSGGGATSAALVPFIQALQRNGIPFDVIGSFSGGAILGVYLATGRLPAYLDRWHAAQFTLMFPAAMCHSKVIQHMLNFEFGHARLEDLDVRFVPMTVQVPGDGDAQPCAVVGGTLGEAVRVSGIGVGLIGPAERRGTRYLDGGIAFGVPAAVLPDFGADMVIAGNSIVPPHGRDLNAVLPWDIGRLLELNPFVDLWWYRMSDVFVGMLTALRQTARQGAEDADAYYEVSPDETPFLEAFKWHALDRIRQTADNPRRWMPALDRSIEQWQRLRGMERT